MWTKALSNCEEDHSGTARQKGEWGGQEKEGIAFQYNAVLAGEQGKTSKLEDGGGGRSRVLSRAHSYLCYCRRKEHSRSTFQRGPRQRTWSSRQLPRRRTSSQAAKATQTVSLTRAVSPAHLEEAWSVAPHSVRPKKNGFFLMELLFWKVLNYYSECGVQVSFGQTWGHQHLTCFEFSCPELVNWHWSTFTNKWCHSSSAPVWEALLWSKYSNAKFN